MTREERGEIVRNTWIGWARRQPNPKPNWLTPWNGLTAPEREVDMLIGDAVARAERARIRGVIDPAQLRKLADWFDADDEFKTTMFPATWPQRGHEVQDDLRAWADLLEQQA